MESNKKHRYYKTISNVIVLSFFILLLISCNTITKFCSKGKQQTYFVSEYSYVILDKDGTFGFVNKMIINTTGSYEKYKDTIYLTSKFREDTIKLDTVLFELKEDYSKDSIYVHYYLSGTRSIPPVYVTFYDEDENTLTYDYPFDKAIVNSKYTKFKLNFEKSSSKLIAFPNEPFNYLFFTFDYTSRPEHYLFMNNDKFLIQGDKLIKIE